MRRTSWLGGAIALCLLVATPALAQSGSGHYRDGHYGPYSANDSFRLRLGLFTPRGDSEYWTGAEDEFTAKTSDFEDIVFGGDWIHTFSPYVGLMLSGDYYQGQTDMSYRNFVDSHGHEIRHTTTFEEAPFTAGIVFRLAPEELPIHPYVGVGGGLYTWRLEESGDFVDFTNGNHIFTDRFEDTGATFGYYGLVGIDVPLSRSFSVFAEGRWDYAKDDLSGDFAGLGKIDLGGQRLTGGVAWHF